VIQPLDPVEEADAPPLPPVSFAPLAPAPAASQRVWTVFVAFAASMASAAALAVCVLVGITAIAAYRLDGALPGLRRDDLEHVARSPAGLLGGGLAACLSFALCALVPASLSPELFEARLRLARRPRWLAWGIAAALGMLGVGQACSGVFALAGLDEAGALGQIHRALWRPSPALAAASFAIVGVGAGVAEELFFRGYAQTRLAQRWGATASVVVSAALFGVAHLDPIHSTFAFLAGLFLGWASLRTGSVRVTAVAHVLNNAVSLVGMAITDPARRTPTSEAIAQLVAGAVLLAVSVVALRRAHDEA
jgi:membrane protease YdiL (CAAX protease family)